MANAVEILEKLERRLTITIPVDEVEKEIDQRLKIQAKSAKAAGFRKGKVPMNMVRAQYGHQIEGDVVREKIYRAFDQVAQEKDLSIAGYPKFKQKTDDVPEGAIAFHATFEVYPEVQLGDFGAIDLEKLSTEITGAEVDNTINMLRKRQAHYHAKGEQSDHGDGGADASAQDGDRITVDFIGKVDGVEFEGGKANDFPFTLGEGQMLPEFEYAALGMKKGESKTFPLDFPEDYHGDEVAGKTAEFTITVKNVEWAHLPDVNEDFARMLGVADGSVDKMRAEIEKNLKMETKSRLAALNKKRVMDALLGATTFDLPDSLLQQEMQQMMQAALKDLKDKGMPVRMDEPLPPEMFSEQAERRLRLGLIFAELIRDDKFSVSDDEVRARAEEIGSTYENPKMIVDYYMNEPNRRKELEALVMEDKVVDYVFDHAKTVEKAMSFSELMAQQI